MQTNHSKTIKGLSIAVIVISAISIFSCIAGLFALGVGAFAWDQYGMDSIVYSHNQHEAQWPATSTTDTTGSTTTKMTCSA